LILTYAGEFDRAHYPLPLAHDPDPSPAALRRTVERLRAELAVSKDGSDNGGSASGSGGSSSRGGQLQVMPARPGRLAELEVENRKLSAALVEAKAKLVAASAEAECAGKVEAQIGDMAQAYERLRADYEGLRNGEKTQVNDSALFISCETPIFAFSVNMFIVTFPIVLCPLDYHLSESAREVRRLKGESRSAQARVAELVSEAAGEGRRRAGDEGLGEAALRHRADKLAALLEDERASSRRTEVSGKKKRGGGGHVKRRSSGRSRALFCCSLGEKNIKDNGHISFTLGK
jgi:hypothetical protein